jgi:peptidoglycan/LPS O-acetylase OafA/YrhL
MHHVRGPVRHLGLDGLRGIAIVAVVVFHGGVGLAGGALGVDLFLVLSGYLISSLLLAEMAERGRVDLRAFWARRLRRLLPALLVLVTAVAVLAAVTGREVAGVDTVRADALATLAYVANWRFVFADGGYFASFGAPSPLRHAWSLAVEEQWYLLWPPVLWGLWRALGRRPLLLAATLLGGAVGSAALMARWAADVDRVHYGTDTRAQALLVGAAVAVLTHRRPLRAWRARTTRVLAVLALPAGALVVAGFVVAGGTEPWLYRGGHLAFAVAACVVLVGALVPGPVRAVLSVAPMRWLGEVSYGLYLWHWPVFVWLSPGRTSMDGWSLFAVRVAVSILLAVISARFVEQPFRRQRLRLPRPGLVAVAATTVVAVVVVGAAAVGRDAGPRTALASRPELPEGFDLSTVVAAAERPATPVEAPSTTGAPAPLPAPVPAVPNGVVDVAVVGDSTGWTLAWDIEVPPGIRATNGGLLGCGLNPAAIVVAGVAKVIQGDPVPCGAPAEALWADRVLAANADVVMLTIGAWEVFDRQPEGGPRLEVGTPAWARWVDADLHRITADLAALAPQALLALPDVPCFDERVDGLGGPTSPRNDPDRVAAVNDILRRFAAENPARVRLLPMSEWVCPGGSPVGAIDGVTLRPDGVHTADAGAALLWERWLGPALTALVPAP